MSQKTKVMIVDDSALIRRVMADVLARDPDIEVVAVASDPLFALDKLQRVRPDVIVLDIEMPRMDGLTFLRQLMATSPIPVVVCSGLAGAGTEVAIAALEAGAVEVIAKSQLGVREFVEESAEHLQRTVKAAALAKILWAGRARPPRVERVGGARSGLVGRSGRALEGTDKVIAIGASTGGTEAIREVLEALPLGVPGVVIVQHMPEHFTAAFAKRLDDLAAIEVREARDGDRVRPGLALIAPGDHHLELARNGAQYVVRVSGGPRVSGHRPSVDVLFRSVARSAGPNAVGVILTGMGADGAEGMVQMRDAGALTLAEDEASCVVFGMPREAIRRGAAAEVLSLGDLPKRVLAAVGAAPPRGVVRVVPSSRPR